MINFQSHKFLLEPAQISANHSNEFICYCTFDSRIYINIIYIYTHTPVYILLLLFSCLVLSDSLQSQGLQDARPPYPSPSPRVCSNSCPLNWGCHPTISSSVIPFSSCLQSFPASGSFPVSQLSASGGPSIGLSASTSIPPMNTQD